MVGPLHITIEIVWAIVFMFADLPGLQLLVLYIYIMCYADLHHL
jgi:hypothetical protein